MEENPRFFDLVGQVRAMRRLKPDPVPAALVRKVCEMGTFAPSGGNRQGWNVISVSDPSLRRELLPLMLPAMRRYLAQWEHGEVPWNPVDETSLGDEEIAAFEVPKGMLDLYATAPVLLVVTLDLRVVAAMDQHLDRVGVIPGASVYPFVWNILLAARSEGLGGTLTTFLASREPEAQALLGIPEDVAIAALLPLGRPVKQLTRLRRKPVAEILMLDRWRHGEASKGT